MRKWHVLACVGGFLVLAACRKAEPVSPVHFAREEIAMDVRPGTLEVRGMYHFTSSSKDPLVASVFYPFPLDPTHLYPDSVEIRQHGFQRQDSGVSFKMRFQPGVEDSFFAYYQQPLKANSATYIVTTTRKWKRPIDRARFHITVPENLTGVTLTYKADSTVMSGGTVSYFFTRKQFYPDKDVTVKWK
ncbi:MAG TPA: hypothetical protein VMH22_12255 [bacterium]|nr:hypothetical protein [bacterium]